MPNRHGDAPKLDFDIDVVMARVREAVVPYAPAALDQFSKVMASAQGKVLLHCTIAWRASHMWGAYLIRERKMPVATALTHVRGINLLEDKPFGNQQPIEGFLGRTLPELPRPKPQP